MRCQVLIGSVLVAGALAVPAPAQADPAATTTIRYALPTTDAVTDVLALGSEVWIAAGNSVLITSPTGKVRTTVTGLLGAKGLTRSADGASVYVSESTGGKIAQVSAAGEVLGSWPSQGCPGKSSIAGGALYYAYTCAGSSKGVGRMDLTDHTDKSVLTDSSVDELTAAGSHLVTYAVHTSAGMTGYTIGEDGLLTKVGPAEFGDYIYDAEMSADGSQVIATDYSNGYGVARFDTATMTLAGRFTTGAYPTAVAWSPDEKRLAGKLDVARTGVVQIFDAVTGSALVKSGPTDEVSYDSEAHEASWSPDGSTIYFLAQERGKTAYLVATPTAGQVKASVSVTVAAAKAYGKNLTITVRTSQRPRTAARVTVVQNGATTVKNVTTSASGVATVTVAARANGKVTVTTAADAKYLAATASASFKTPSVLAVSMLRGTTRKGVVHYKSVSAVLGGFAVLPARAAMITVTLQHKSGKSWKSDGSVTIAAERDGVAGVVLKRGAKKVTFRFLGKAAADATAGAAPSVTSRPFIVD